LLQLLLDNLKIRDTIIYLMIIFRSIASVGLYTTCPTHPERRQRQRHPAAKEKT